MLATASFDDKVRLFELPSGKPRAVFDGHTDDVRSVGFSPDGRQIASAGNDKTVRLWDVDSGKSQAVITGHTNKVRALAFDSRGRFLASTGNDQTIRVIDRASLQVKAILQSPANGSSVAFSPDGASLVGGDDLGNVSIWDTADWSKRPLAKLANGPVWGLGFSVDGRTLAIACSDTNVRNSWIRSPARCYSSSKAILNASTPSRSHPTAEPSRQPVTMERSGSGA